MATVEDAIFARGSAHAGLTALIGAGLACRLYPVNAPEGPTFPLVVYHLVDETEDQAMGASAGVVHHRIQFTTLGLTHDSARDVDLAVKAAFVRLSGTFAGVIVQDSLPEAASAPRDPDAGLYRRDRDIVLHVQAA